MGIVVFFSEGTSTGVQLSRMMVYKVIFAIIFLLLDSTWSGCVSHCGECPPDGYAAGCGEELLQHRRLYYEKYVCECCSPPGGPATCSALECCVVEHIAAGST